MFGSSPLKLQPARLFKGALVSFLAVALTGVTASSAPHGSQESNNPRKPVPVTRLVVTFGTNTTAIWGGNLSGGSRIVVRDREAWDSLWKRILTPDLPPGVPPDPNPRLPPLPDIDFSREMLVIVGMGQKPSGGYRIIINSGRELEKRIEIEVQSMSPCGLAPAILTSPIDIVRIPKTDLPVTFREVEVKCKDRLPLLSYTKALNASQPSYIPRTAFPRK